MTKWNSSPIPPEIVVIVIVIVVAKPAIESVSVVQIESRHGVVAQNCVQEVISIHIS